MHTVAFFRFRFNASRVLHSFPTRRSSDLAWNRFACSYDLVNWTDWEGPHLIEPSEDYDSRFAHKSFVLKHDGVVYHFYKDRKSTRLNSSHVRISYAVFCLKKKKIYLK